MQLKDLTKKTPSLRDLKFQLIDYQLFTVMFLYDNLMKRKVTTLSRLEWGNNGCTDFY